ncbi:MAG TPA: 3-dehydroquinate synthase [Candidatus Nanoarchaeia archaeon]|nr:3-dehydroquinate synthase [Candidatus Nanoarchaeia archaeon]
MARLRLNLGTRSYNIEIGRGNLLHTGFRRFGSRYAVITDSNVKRLYAKKLESSLRRQGLDAEVFEFPAGEASKNPETAARIGREMARKGFDRDSIIIALGGGVAGDLVGYIASFYMRGIDYIQVPTTLLAQVDSSIGGKVGVDIPEGKNMFGYFHQPKAVIIDVETLKTLPKKEIQNGLAEIVKYGMAQDSELFEYLEKNVKRNSSFADMKFYQKVVEKSCRIKAGIVERDEKEKELRKILNYGHTIGHAIESAEKYRLSHGEAIALGMAYEGKVSLALGLLDKKSLARQNELIKEAGLPVKYSGRSSDELIKIMRRDKKARGGKLYFVLPTSVGRVKSYRGKVAFPVDESIVRKCLKE